MPPNTQNNNARNQITSIIAKSNTGAIIRTSELADTLGYRFCGYTTRTVGVLLRERDDVVRVKDGVWRVL